MSCDESIHNENCTKLIRATTTMEKFSFYKNESIYNSYFRKSQFQLSPDSVTDFSVFLNSAGSRMLLDWDFQVGIFARKAMLNMGWVL